MKISSIIDIVDGELLNSPSISFINNIKTDPTKVKIADLFIAKNEEDLKLAIKNEAYAVLFEEDFKVIDSELAFIKVKNIKKAILSIIRYKLANKSIKAFLCTNISYDLVKALFLNSSNKSIHILPNSIDEILKLIDNIEDNSLIFSDNKEVLTSILASFEIFEKDIENHSIKNLTIHSLFELSFSYKNRFYSRIKIAALYIKSLINCLEFFKDYEVDLSKLSRFKNLKAIFLDKHQNIIEFGKSDTFLITQNNISLAKHEVAFIKEYFKYATKVFISNIELDFLEKDEQIIINSLEELKDILEGIEYNSAFIFGFENQKVFDYFSKPKNYPTLF